MVHADVSSNSYSIDRCGNDIFYYLLMIVMWDYFLREKSEVFSICLCEKAKWPQIKGVKNRPRMKIYFHNVLRLLRNLRNEGADNKVELLNIMA